MDDGHIVVDSITPITMRQVTGALARESGFDSRKDLLEVARHGTGDQVFLIRFHYVAAGVWDVSRPSTAAATNTVVGSRMFACLAVHRSAEPNTLVVRVDVEQRDALLTGFRQPRAGQSSLHVDITESIDHRPDCQNHAQAEHERAARHDIRCAHPAPPLRRKSVGDGLRTQRLCSLHV